MRQITVDDDERRKGRKFANRNKIRQGVVVELADVRQNNKRRRNDQQGVTVRSRAAIRTRFQSQCQPLDGSQPPSMDHPRRRYVAATRRAMASAGPPSRNGKISRTVRLAWDRPAEETERSDKNVIIVSATIKQIRWCHCMRLLPKAPMQTTSRPYYTNSSWAARTATGLARWNANRFESSLGWKLRFGPSHRNVIRLPPSIHSPASDRCAAQQLRFAAPKSWLQCCDNIETRM